MRGNLLAEQILFNIGQVSLTSALLILPLLALRRLLRKRYPARVLCLVWAVLVVRLLIPVQLSLPETPVQVTPRLTYVSYADTEKTDMVAVQSPSAERRWVETAEAPSLERPAMRVYYGVVLFWVWACGALWLMARQMRGYSAYARRLRRTAWAVEEPELLSICHAEARRLNLRKSPPLLQSTEADSPMLAGVLRPTLVIPAEGVDPDVAPLVLRHELIHYQRRDLWLKLAATAAKCLHWFNPAVWLLSRALFEDIELACDSKVVEGLDSQSRKRYGKAILDCAESQCTARQTLTTCFANDKETLKTRLNELFVTNAKRRGIALLVVCALTVGIVGGAVTIGGGKDASTEADNGVDEASTLAGETLNEEIIAILTARLGESRTERNAELVMPYLTEEMQRETFQNAYDFYTGEKPDYQFDPDAPHYGVPEEANEGFWRFGVSSPYVNAYTVIPDVEHDSARMVYNWHTSASIDTRSGEQLRFAKENGEWRISGRETLPDGYFDDGIDTTEAFQMLYGNDLGLPDFLNFVMVAGTQGGGVGLYDLSDPVDAAVQCFSLRGGSGEVTGQEMIQDKMLGNIVTYTFADGSAIDFVMSNQYGEGYIPVDWRISGRNSRTMVDLASQWARGTVYKDTHVMFPLLTEQAEADLIAIQKNYSGEDEWYWKHGKYGSSPTAVEFGIFPGEDDHSLRIVYELRSGGASNGREMELVRFKETPAGLKIDRVRDLTNAVRVDGSGTPIDEEVLERNELEWFAMQYLQEPLAGNLSRVPETEGKHAADSPAEAVQRMLHVGDIFEGSPSLLSQQGSDALVRIDFADGSGQVFVSLEKEDAGWAIHEISTSRMVEPVRSAREFADRYGGGNLFDWKTAYQAETPVQDIKTLLESYLQLEDIHITEKSDEVFGKKLGKDCTVRFADGSEVNIIVAERWDGGYYPVDWYIGGENTRNMQDLAEQWATGVCEKDTRMMFPILNYKCTESLVWVQKNYSGEDWGWKHGRYGSSPTATAFSLKQIDDDTMEVVYNEIGGGYFNHHSAERLYFVRENDTLRLDRWEEIERGSESAAEWYDTYYAPCVDIFDRYYDSAQNQMGIADAAKQLAGLNNGDGLEVMVDRVIEDVHLEDVEKPGYLAELRFTDGSGALRVKLAADEDIDGNTVWTLHGLDVVFAKT